MTPDQVRATYDEAYARRYDAAFLHTPEYGFREKTRLELFFLRMLTLQVDSWLDVACGTGFFLRNGRGNPNISCTGLDLSPAMLALAREANPEARFIEGDFLAPHPDLEGRFAFTSCMWGAYGLQESVTHIERLVAQLTRWTRPGGTVFLPVFDPARFVALEAQGRLMDTVTLRSPDGTRWSFLEPDGKLHEDVLAPPLETMRAMFEPAFDSVELNPYPDTPGIPFAALIARGRREQLR
ncbi:methyltransferase domain-containing protein [Pyxidicoccus parkwayensis]|uniref:Methyltransferase domain-containing protein n=1 Tax=Pyxidicoccus parkwayensis TaxID=2813578 RepID=A0ABX7NNW5_9BACT|nr:class I SAM-dependent methyltransferase [Pyxidicoccus parkwaysis]QSQ19096.1 methyltransferase domain-containing protein [Pyxidicoccus parkwaysis]